MTGSTLLLITVLGQLASGDPESLVPRLGAPKYAVREDAATALERLGRRALPSLRAAKQERDPEVRTRAVSLIQKIEGSLLTQPTMISLSFEDTPLPEVLKSINRQAGLSFSLVPEQSVQWANRRVTLRSTDPLPFWKALDELCEAGRLQYNFVMYGAPQGNRPTFQLFDGPSRPNNPFVDSGPFRIMVMALHYQKDVSFPPLPRGPGERSNLRPGSPGHGSPHSMIKDSHSLRA